MSMDKCPKCLSSTIEAGWILSAGKIAFRSDRLRYPFTGGNVRTYVCLDCGYAESYVDPKYLEKIKSKLSSDETHA
jgi:predicted nucleic-acid-binding Zn-ribbon protein